MRRCAFLTLADPTGFVIDDDLAYEPLRELGWQCDAIPWTNSGVPWAGYDAIIIRSPWDYTQRPAEFLRVLQEIESSGAPLCNNLATVKWNLDKSYLRTLADGGIPVVPTVWCDQLRPGALGPLIEPLGEAIVKPVLGAGAAGAFRLRRDSPAALLADAEAYFQARAAMVQPLVRHVISEGEFSLFYFNGQSSHAILKTPQPGDFRVQEEHGGLIRQIQPEHALRAAGDAIVRRFAAETLYARADFVRSNDGTQFWLMELELVEPALYLRMDAQAPRRFAQAIASRFEPARSTPASKAGLTS